VDHEWRAAADSVSFLVRADARVARGPRENRCHGNDLPPGALALVVLAPFWAACSSAPVPSTSLEEQPFPDQRMPFANAGRTLGYVTNGAEDTISVLDLDSLTELGRVPVGRDPVTIEDPTQLAFDRNSDTVYLVFSCPPSANAGPHASHDAPQQPGYVEALARSDLRPLGTFATQPSPAGIALSADGSQLLVTHYDVDLADQVTSDINQRRAQLLRIAPPAGIATATATVTSLTLCVAPYGVVYGKDSSRAYVTCTGEDGLAVVDTVNAAVITRVALSAAGGGVSKPYALVADPSREHVLVSNEVSRSVVLFDTSDAPQPQWTTAFTAGLPGVPAGVPYFAAWISDADVFVPLQGPDGAALLDATSGAVKLAITYSIDQCESPRDAQVTPDGRLFLVCEGDGFDQGAVVEVDATTLEIKARVSIGVGPDHLLVVAP
jgi:DNA-binding beta-propeller fold protein YncE